MCMYVKYIIYVTIRPSDRRGESLQPDYFRSEGMGSNRGKHFDLGLEWSFYDEPPPTFHLPRISQEAERRVGGKPVFEMISPSHRISV